MDSIKKQKKSIPKPTLFGKNLRFLRRINGLSQKQLAEDLDINRNNIASYESSVVEPNAKVFLKFCKYFQKEPYEMLEELMAENAVEIAHLTLEDKDNDQQQIFKEQLDQFVYKTNEMTKIYEGYSNYVELKQNDSQDKTNDGLYATFTDLLSLLQSLIKLNWEMIQTIVPTDSNQDDSSTSTTAIENR